MHSSHCKPRLKPRRRNRESEPEAKRDSGRVLHTMRKAEPALHGDSDSSVDSGIPHAAHNLSLRPVGSPAPEDRDSPSSYVSVCGPVFEGFPFTVKKVRPHCFTTPRPFYIFTWLRAARELIIVNRQLTSRNETFASIHAWRNRKSGALFCIFRQRLLSLSLPLSNVCTGTAGS